jgi:hypothetical protein
MKSEDESGANTADMFCCGFAPGTVSPLAFLVPFFFINFNFYFFLVFPSQFG